MNPLVAAVFAGSLVIVAASVCAAASLLLDKYRANVRARDAALDASLAEEAEERRAEQVADDFLADLDARIAANMPKQGQAPEEREGWSEYADAFVAWHLSEGER